MILLYVVVCGRERWVIEHVIYFEGGERRGHLLNSRLPLEIYDTNIHLLKRFITDIPFLFTYLNIWQDISGK